MSQPLAVLLAPQQTRRDEGSTMTLQRFFVVVAKGKKGKQKTPFLQLQTDAGEKLIVHLASVSELADFNIDDEFAVVIGGGSKQSKLIETRV
jgi:hypothetical protein